MFRFDIKTFERETVSENWKTRQNIGGRGEQRTRKKSRNDQNDERTD